MVAYSCTHCRRPCDLRGGARVLFHEPSGDGGTVCSAACSDALRAAHPDLVPMLSANRHSLRVDSSLAAAADRLGRAAAEASADLAIPVANLLLSGLPIAIKDNAAGQRIGLVWTEAAEAARPLQQAVLHLLALSSYGVKLDDTVAQIAGCDVDRLSTEVAVAGDQCEAMVGRIQRARELVRSRYVRE